MSDLKLTKYYSEFLRYAEMSKWQHHNCNLGNVPYSETPYDDDLIKSVHIYDVCERKYAGFTQLLLDMWYGYSYEHPYYSKMDDERKEICLKFNRKRWLADEWFFIFMVHRLTGSGINYGLSRSGYHNSVLLKFSECEDYKDMIWVIRENKDPMYTSKGYQIAPFPKSQSDNYKRGGDWFICEKLPELLNKFYNFLCNGKTKTFREAMSFLAEYNRTNGFRVFWFQYAAFLSDIADFYPDMIDRNSLFFYGKNAAECLSYLARGCSYSNEVMLDKITMKICDDIGALPYNAEDIACDFIRWVENYIDPSHDYSHLDLNTIWSSHTIEDHPFGRQKAMLDLGLVRDFNSLGSHPSDNKILLLNKLDVQTYKDMVNAKLTMDL